MDEEEKETEEEGTEDVPSDDLLKRAEKAARDMETANKQYEELLKRQERIQARAILSGHSEAGKVPEKKKEKTPQEWANECMDGKFNPLRV